MECAHSLAQACDCLVCIAERIGDYVIGDRSPGRLDKRDDETEEPEK
jgi:hypothetical protein